MLSANVLPREMWPKKFHCKKKMRHTNSGTYIRWSSFIITWQYDEFLEHYVTHYINDKLMRVQFIYNSMLFNYHTRSYTSQHRLEFKSQKKKFKLATIFDSNSKFHFNWRTFFHSEQTAAYFYQESNNMSVSRKKRVLYFYGLFPLYLK